MRFQAIDADGLVAALAGERRPFVLDVRSAAEYEKGHVPGAHNVPVHEMGRRMRELPASKIARVIVVGEPGRRSESAAAWLVLMGWADVTLLDGGFASWRGDVETGPPPPPPPRGPELRILD